VVDGGDAGGLGVEGGASNTFVILSV